MKSSICAILLSLLFCGIAGAQPQQILPAASAAQPSDRAASPAVHTARRPLRQAGFIETVTLYPGGLKYPAKLDTGARTSSLGVTAYRVFRPDGTPDSAPKQVEFSFKTPDGTLKTLTLPLFRIVRIKEQGRESSARPVVMMTLCIGNVVRHTQVNLQKRPRFNYQLLIGRRFLSGAYAIASGRKNIVRDECPAEKDLTK